MISYWDYGECGPYGDDYNWDWCGADSGEACQHEVKTDQCTSGTANLKSVQGNQMATDWESNYKIDDCWYTYYAIYECDTSQSGICNLNL